MNANQLFRIRIALLLMLCLVAITLLLSYTRVGDNANAQTLERELFKLSDKELFKLGITQVEDPPGNFDWMVAWSDSSDETLMIVLDALELQKIGAVASCGHGRAGWYVTREEFFKARNVLLESQAVYQRGVIVVTPRTKLQ